MYNDIHILTMDWNAAERKLIFLYMCAYTYITWYIEHYMKSACIYSILSTCAMPFNGLWLNAKLCISYLLSFFFSDIKLCYYHFIACIRLCKSPYNFRCCLAFETCNFVHLDLNFKCRIRDYSLFFEAKRLWWRDRLVRRRIWHFWLSLFSEEISRHGDCGHTSAFGSIGPGATLLPTLQFVLSRRWCSLPQSVP